LTAREFIGLDPSPELLLMARDRAAVARVPVKLLQGFAEAMPLDNASVDTTVTTWTLCIIPNVRRTLAELRRVMRPGGAAVRRAWPCAGAGRGTRARPALPPLWTRVAGGCHLNRRIDNLISDSGFQIDALANARPPGARTDTFLYQCREWRTT
jgi:SAM-dependent methyltransferase